MREMYNLYDLIQLGFSLREIAIRVGRPDSYSLRWGGIDGCSLHVSYLFDSDRVWEGIPEWDGPRPTRTEGNGRYFAWADRREVPGADDCNAVGCDDILIPRLDSDDLRELAAEYWTLLSGDMDTLRVPPRSRPNPMWIDRNRIDDLLIVLFLRKTPGLDIPTMTRLSADRHEAVTESKVAGVRAETKGELSDIVYEEIADAYPEFEFYCSALIRGQRPVGAAERETYVWNLLDAVEPPVDLKDEHACLNCGLWLPIAEWEAAGRCTDCAFLWRGIPEDPPEGAEEVLEGSPDVNWSQADEEPIFRREWHLRNWQI